MGALTGKVAIVTGGGSGIGRAISLRFASDGASVAVLDLRGDAADETVQLIQAAGGDAVAVQADVTDRGSLDAAVAAAEDRFGPVSVLSSNAGRAAYPAPVDAASDDDFDAIYAVNVRGVWNTVRAAIPSLRRAGGGSIIITGSIMGERARPGQAAYASSKAAANHLARSFALDLADDGIRVNALAPVVTDTAMLPMFLGPDHPEEARARFLSTIPLGRLATPEDVAATAAFLASDDSSFITGAVLPVDGGRGI